MFMTSSAAVQSFDFGMDTEIIHTIYGRHAKAALKAVRVEAKRLESLLSCFLPDSEISRINHYAGRNFVKLSTDTYKVLNWASIFSACSGGLFDITIGPLVNLWDFRLNTIVPAEEKIHKLMDLVNHADLSINERNKTALLKKQGQSVNLGGIGKGYASDKMLEILRSFNISSAYINLGGNVAVLGTKPDCTSWRVGIQHPRMDDRLLGVVTVTDQSVVTSGDYQRYFLDPTGRRYHHLLNPITGYPADSGLISVTIVSDSGITADGLSTAIFVSGLEKGLHILKCFPGTEAILVDANLTVYVTYGLKDRFYPDANIQTQIIA
jgi:thiamine biosynthesis lipoprotein